MGSSTSIYPLNNLVDIKLLELDWFWYPVWNTFAVFLDTRK